ncbi:glycine betaine ABC transporter substrate-binding protein [Kineococcus sp. TBRC 1896]|uniref:Glycine betaine ABC transporter substrate-binding protein n=1 Tax=Kineococcus mangrovi TaxID=1660183 RepID=A0ABV4I5A7_9ACTN
MTQKTVSRATFGRLSVGLAAAGVVAACSGESATNSAGSSQASTSDDVRTVNLGFLPGWTDGLSTAYLWKNLLEGEGYAVEFTELSDAAPLYTALAQGDVDVYPSGWPQVTHQDYMNQYGDQIEDLGAWYEGAVLTLVVPEYTDVDSIDQLAGQGARFGGRIVGIEPGAGLTRITREQAMPETYEDADGDEQQGYGLEGEYELVTSSTAAMLAELQSATDAQQDIVVTLWRPFWANTSFPVKDLADPRGAMGQAETLNSLARQGFAEDMPDVADMMSNFTLTDEQYGTLEDTVVNEYGEGRYDEGVQAWLDQNPDFRESLRS